MQMSYRNWQVNRPNRKYFSVVDRHELIHPTQFDI